MHLYFSNVGENLYVRNNEVLKGFAIAGADKIFIWADAKIVGNNEIVASSKSNFYQLLYGMLRQIVQLKPT
ncbi:MAG: hypothetical protein H7068_09960 [Pedobacter sp.]|nr:hypothetical protein [Chitinophagaceae bacterium]